MRLLLILCVLAIGGCVSQPAPEVAKLQSEVRNLKEEMTDISRKLDKTKRTANAASSKANAAVVEVKAAKETANKALDASSVPPAPTGEAKILKPRQINHETSILP